MLAYTIADTLAMEVKWDSKAEKIRGSKERVLMFGDVSVPMRVTIVDSKTKPDKVTVLVRVLGNLMLLVTASLRRTRVYMLNAAKYDGDANDLLTMTDCFDHKSICRGLGKAAVQVWETEGASKSKWVEIEIAKDA
jgi:hypothetical protein